MITCTVCEGDKKQTVKVTGNAMSSFEVDCLGCLGRGEITEDRAKQIRAQETIWCKCRTSCGSHYVPGGRNSQMHKHHWRCNGCGKVTKIG